MADPHIGDIISEILNDMVEKYETRVVQTEVEAIKFGAAKVGDTVRIRIPKLYEVRSG